MPSLIVSLKNNGNKYGIPSSAVLLSAVRVRIDLFLSNKVYRKSSTLFALL